VSTSIYRHSQGVVLQSLIAKQEVLCEQVPEAVIGDLERMSQSCCSDIQVFNDVFGNPLGFHSSSDTVPLSAAKFTHHALSSFPAMQYLFPFSAARG
jgi:hypothetical protein